MTTAGQLRRLLGEQEEILAMPCVYDGLTARMVEQAGFPLTFMTGFGVAAARGYPDTGLVSYGEMVESARGICESLRQIPCIGDGDTGYGNAVNVKRTVRGYAQVGLAGIMIEDQVAPKRCGHTQGKDVVSRAEAAARLAAALDARGEGADMVIVARTDARAVAGLGEALARCQLYAEMGADITFLEAPHSVEEMERYCREVPGPKLANMLEMGQTPLLSRRQLWEMGYAIAAYPLTLLSAGVRAMQAALHRLEQDRPVTDLVLDFQDLKQRVGFEDYDRESQRYRL